MDLKDFSLEKETSSEMHVKHPSGKVLVLNKASMSDKAKSLVKKMACGGEVKGYSDGGQTDTSHIYGADDVDNKIAQEKQHAKEVTSQSQGSSNDQTDVRTPEQKEKQKAANITYGYADGGEIVGQNSVLAPQAEVSPVENAMQVNLPQVTSPVAQAPVVAQPADPMVTQKISENDLLTREQNQAKELQSAQMGAAQGAVQANSELAAGLGSLPNPNKAAQEEHAKNEAFGKALLEDKIDPNRYWHNLSTGSKIGAGIALALGGVGAGLTGQKNPALEFFNKAIDNDIDAQKNEQGKKMSLWKMNREAYGDDVRANLATQNQLITIAQAKLAKSAAQVQAPEAKYHAQQVIDGLEKQKLSNTERLGLYQQDQQAGGQGFSGADPLKMATDPNIVPMDRQKDVINELGKSKYVADHAAELRQAYDAAEKEQTAMQRIGRLGHEGPAMKNLRLLGAPLLKDNDGKVNENAISTFEDILPGPFERESTGLSKKEAFNNFLKLHSDAPMARAYNLSPDRFTSTSSNPMARLQPNERAIYNWAKTNPRLPNGEIDPRAAAAMTKFKGMGIK